ncbi:MAG: hypothetical protein HY905_01490 [Deltaproteobacteria bacterium]|nr:hypothetical protein [Deltaproteobacteria bacterium]
MAYQQYPPQQPQYPQQPFPQPGAPPPPVAPPPQAFPAPAAGPAQPSDLSKVGQFGLFTFIAVGACVGMALFGWILQLAKVANYGAFFQFAGYLGSAALTLLGLTIVVRLLDKKT